ncbi:MAG: hypothetical protein HY903_04845 [Deltaproteobacteria bacterium]|nr:hypothetical protein [Deltaproteobacteria bacterium]
MALVAVLVAISSWPGAASAAHDERPPAETGGLHRAAASLEIVLDVYRLALVELVPAATKVFAAGQAPEATTATPIPEPALEVFRRLSLSVPSRVSATALPVVSRAYHAEVTEALEELAAAARIAEVGAPLRRLHHAIAKICDAADDIVDLFSRQRPIQVRVIDSSAALQDIGEALDEVAAAETNIARLRAKDAAVGDQLDAFLRLEVALAHALDLIAAADEAGLHIGFEASRATEAFAALRDRVRIELELLSGVLRGIETPSAGAPAHLTAVLALPEPGKSAEARLVWDPPLGVPGPAVVRIERRPDVAALQARLRLAFVCDGKSADSIEALVRTATEGIDPKPVVVAELAPGRGSYTDVLAEAPLVAPIYQVTALSALGAKSGAAEATALLVPAGLEGPPLSRARALGSEPQSSDFYYDHDQVEVSWELPESDVTHAAAPLRARAAELRRPLVTGYRILRFSEGVPKVVGRVAAGVSRFVDRVPSRILSTVGVRYAVEAQSGAEGVARPPSACALTKPVTLDVGRRLELATAGVGWLSSPTAFEAETLAGLSAAAALAEAKETVAGWSEPERQRRLATWWHAQPAARRIGWARQWPTLVSEAERAGWLLQAATAPGSRDLPRIAAELWLSTQPPEVQEEVDRWWALLDSVARATQIAAYERRMNTRARESLEAARARGEAGLEWSSLRPARLAAWLASRDPNERLRLDEWWQAIPEAARREAASEWLSTLPADEQLAIRWPDWQQRSAVEQRAFLEDGWRELPSGLEARALAGVLALRHFDQSGAELEAAMREEVSALPRVLTRLRYAARPLDVWLGFWLWPLAVVAGLAAPVGWVFVRRRRSITG